MSLLPVFTPPSTTSTATHPPATITEGYFRGIVDLRSTGSGDPMQGVDTSFYPLCNEIEQDKTLQTLPKIATTQETVHVGFSINFNYDVIAHRKSRFAIVADIAPRALQYYANISVFLKKCNTRQEFAQVFQKHLSEQAKSYFGLPPDADITMLCDLSKELIRPGSWLATDDGFQTVKSMHEENRILYLNLNILNATGIGSIREWIRLNHLSLDTVYVSNIPEWLKPGNEPTDAGYKYLDTIGPLIQPHTYVIDAFKRTLLGRGSPAQRVLQGRVELPVYERVPFSRKANPHGAPSKLVFD